MIVTLDTEIIRSREVVRCNFPIYFLVVWGGLFIRMISNRFSYVQSEIKIKLLQGFKGNAVIITALFTKMLERWLKEYIY